MGLNDVANYFGKINEMKDLIAEVQDKELKHKLKENFQWLMNHDPHPKAEQTDYLSIP